MRHIPRATDPRFLSDLHRGGDAAIFQLADDLALVQTVDYITPIVDDPYTFGAIAAANALSDLYAVGARPVLALNLVGFPVKTLPLSMLEEILRGGSDKVIEAGASIAGGHSIDDHEPKYGLAATGLVHPDRMITNAGAKPGDSLILTKPLGMGVITTGIDRRVVDEDLAQRAMSLMTQLNDAAMEAMIQVGVHACTDISGFGLLGHLHNMASASGVGAQVLFRQVPMLHGALELVERDCIPDGTWNNMDYLEGIVDWEATVPREMKVLLSDAQTSGGLLIAVPKKHADALLDALAKTQTPAETIGLVLAGQPGKIQVVA